MLLTAGTLSQDQVKLVSNSITGVLEKFLKEVLLPKSKYELTDVQFRQMASEYSEGVELVMIACQSKRQI